MNTYLPALAALWVLALSLILFLRMGKDKRLAKARARRISEKSLFLLALLGGAPGGLLGMEVFRHKTKHWTFVWGFRILALLQLAGLFLLVHMKT